jgi:glycosyltransferase involved in cell wall biosynthesis
MAPDLIVDGVSGALVAADDVSAMVAGVRQMLALPDRGAALRGAARDAVKIADWSVVGRRHLEEVWRPLLAETAPE